MRICGALFAQLRGSKIEKRKHFWRIANCKRAAQFAKSCLGYKRRKTVCGSWFWSQFQLLFKGFNWKVARNCASFDARSTAKCERNKQAPKHTFLQRRKHNFNSNFQYSKVRSAKQSRVWRLIVAVPLEELARQIERNLRRLRQANLQLRNSKTWSARQAGAVRPSFNFCCSALGSFVCLFVVGCGADFGAVSFFRANCAFRSAAACFIKRRHFLIKQSREEAAIRL